LIYAFCFTPLLSIFFGCFALLGRDYSHDKSRSKQNRAQIAMRERQLK